jgi:hypothetical protein
MGDNTNKYEVTNLAVTDVVTESGVYTVETNVDSLGYVDIAFGSSFSLRLNYENVEQLETLLSEARHVLEQRYMSRTRTEEDTIEVYNPNDPSSW